MMMLVLTLGTMISFSSCSSDDYGPAIEIPKYAENAISLSINSSASPYSSIEFTESGTYVIIPKNGAKYSSMQTMNSIFVAPATVTTRAEASSGIIYGSYTVDGDVYILQGFGTITVIKSDNGHNASLVIQRTGEENPLSISAQVRDQYSESPATQKLCSSWIIEKFVMKIENEGVEIKEFSGTYRQVFEQIRDFCKQYGAPDDVIEEMNAAIKASPEEIIFTSSGTYIVFYANNTLAVSTWKWKDEAQGIAYYGWDYGKFYEDDLFVINYEKNRLVLSEDNSVSGIRMTAKTIMRQKQ